VPGREFRGARRGIRRFRGACDPARRRSFGWHPFHRSPGTAAAPHVAGKVARYLGGQDRCQIQDALSGRKMKIAMKKFLLPITLLLAACGTNDAPVEKEAGTQPDAVAMQERIRSMEDSLAGHIAVDLRSAHTLIDVYKAYATAHPLSHE